jgi:hypothetical protein
LHYLCRDQHVKDVGVWIDDWSYTKGPGGQPGKLHYKLSSILSDDDIHDHVYSHKVSVLGLRPLARVTATKQ